MRLTDAARAVRAGAGRIAWLVKGVMGEDAYEKYKAHYEATHAHSPVRLPAMTEREFWRDQTDRQDSNPQGRCC